MEGKREEKKKIKIEQLAYRVRLNNSAIQMVFDFNIESIGIF